MSFWSMIVNDCICCAKTSKNKKNKNPDLWFLMIYEELNTEQVDRNILKSWQNYEVFKYYIGRFLCIPVL